MPDIFRYDKTPEELGVSPKWLTRIYRRLNKRKFLSHGLMIVKDAAVIAEGYWSPFYRDEPHRMYSTSKTFVATAIGMLIKEGKLSLDDRIVTFFPEELPESVPEWLDAMTVRDLLTMTTCYTDCTYSFDRMDWVSSFFNTAPTHPSGTYFHYDTTGSFILDVIVERLAGKPFMDYLYEVLLGEAGAVRGVRCVKSPDGYSWGGSGVLGTMRDLARLGQIYLDKGVVHGKQLLPRDFAEAAVSRQVDNNVTGHLDHFHGQGYGYQIWCAEDDCFAFLGMGGQLRIASPKHRLILAAISDVQGSQTGYHYLADLFYELIESIEENEGEIADDPAARGELAELLSSLTCQIPLIGEPTSPLEGRYYGKRYSFAENELGIERLCIEKRGDHAALCFRARGEDKEILFGLGEYKIAPFPETHYDGAAVGTPMGRGYRTMSAALWTEESKLVIRSSVIDDYLGNLTTTLAFKGDTVTVYMDKVAEHFLQEYRGLCVGKVEN